MAGLSGEECGTATLRTVPQARARVPHNLESRERDASDEPHPRRRRRLDLRALARQLLSRPACRTAGSCTTPAASSPPSRSTAPSTAPSSRDLRQVARRDARRLRVLAQGAPLHHPPARCWRRRGEGDRALHRQRHRGAGRQARARSSGSSCRPSRSTPDDFEAFLRLLPREVQGRPLRHVLDVRHRASPREEYLELLARARLHHGVHRFGEVSRHPACAQRAGLPAADAQRRRIAPRAIRRSDLRRGRRARGNGWQAERAQRGLRVLHQRREGAGAARGDGVPAAAG